MKLVSVSVENFRQFDEVELNFENDITILAGANNSGKTSLVTLIRNIMSSDKIIYSDADIPAGNIKKWIEEAYPIFENYFLHNDKSDDLDSELLEKFLPNEEGKAQIVICPTSIKIQLDYNPSLDDIKNFADYIMDLDEKEHSFYFIYSFELNRTFFGKNLVNNFNKLRKRFIDVKEPNKDAKKRSLNEMLVKIYVSSIVPKCYFCDKNYLNKCEMEDTRSFRKLFNFTYIKASRPLDDDTSDHSHLLSKKMISMARQDDRWNALIEKLPDDILQHIQKADIAEKVRETSLDSLKETISSLEQTNGGHASEIMLDMSIDEEDIGELLNRITSATYKVDGYYLSEASQGLGYSNMIYIHLQLREFEKNIDPLLVNIFFIEEPESHMHPQMQMVFIKYLLKYYQEQGLQGLVTTHSNEMVRVAGLSHLRVIRQIGVFKSKLYNLSSMVNELRNSTIEEDKELANFYDWFFEIGYSEIVFADKAILYEGDTERLFIRKLLTLEKYKKLSQQYISFIQVGGAFASNYKRLIETLGIKTLIITDADYVKEARSVDDIKKSTITNATIKKFYKDFNTEEPTMETLYAWSNSNNNIVSNKLIYLAYQLDIDHYARTLEEAMLGKYFNMDAGVQIARSEWKSKRDASRLKFSIPNNKDGEKDTLYSLRDILKSTSNGKTDFMYSVILNKVVEEMEPEYIRKGLEWLMQ